METGFANMLCVLVFFRLCNCASTDLHQGDTPRRTTVGVEFYGSGGYKTETDYRTVPTALDQTTHTLQMGITDRTEDQSNPCLSSHQNFCINGKCQFHRNLNTTSCICHLGFTGERCHSITLESFQQTSYDLSTILPVIAVVLSVLCLTVFTLFLVIRHQKKHKPDVECEEKHYLKVTP